ncbi:2OG-Fe dioxygenase family protein [Nocardia sp. CDC159]|uniref:2OG-Fe dioxygenase family protein n=1 Tax=Nocardia pulmonis TaxID=2951408 RepID=A0A9X2J363_9NOCA|nr:MULTISPECIES: 2OG-Fe dioxygenase family protein [Nocardia]MCM6778781.1 2OG-Fe dioxygenase family protein [Nocardia pulmonis]MCM6791670.1 2OG-Fe dioxygenase family protein [Nocardia sp. CDC159]
MPNFGPEGFKLVDLPPVGEDILRSYHEVELDPYIASGTRYKRFSQYRLTHTSDHGWEFELLPHRAYTAFKKFNPVAGGMLREYQPISVDFRPLVKAVLDEHDFLDPSVDWQINVHQNRSVTTHEKPAPLTPEGKHQDGHEFVMISVLNRTNVVGGQMRLWRDPQDTQPLWEGTLQPGDAALLDDRAVYHDVTDIVPGPEGDTGSRDILIVSFSRWDEKWYGDEHDQAVLSEAAR